MSGLLFGINKYNNSLTHMKGGALHIESLNLGYISGNETVGDTVKVYGLGGTPLEKFAPEDFGFGERNSNTRRDAQYGLSVVSIEDNIINRPPFAITNANPVTTSSLGFEMNCLPGINYSIATYDLSGRRIWSDDGVIIEVTQEVYTLI